METRVQTTQGTEQRQDVRADLPDLDAMLSTVTPETAAAALTTIELARTDGATADHIAAVLKKQLAEYESKSGEWEPDEAARVGWWTGFLAGCGHCPQRPVRRDGKRKGA